MRGRESRMDASAASSSVRHPFQGCCFIGALDVISRALLDDQVKAESVWNMAAWVKPSVASGKMMWMIVPQMLPRLDH